MPTQRRRRRLQRDTVLFTVGLGLTIHEGAIRSGPERPSLLVLYGAMMSLPAYLQADAKRRERKADTGEIPVTGDKP